MNRIAITLIATMLALPLAARAETCDRTCLEGVADTFLAALAKQDPASLKWAPVVRNSENSVSMNIGEGIWGTATATHPGGVMAADPHTGNVVWLGVVEEHGQPAFMGLRLRAVNGTVADVESVVARKGEPIPYGTPETYKPDAVFAKSIPQKARRSRDEMIAIVQDYYDSKLSGTLKAMFTRKCARVIDGVTTTSGDHPDAKVAKGCAAQVTAGAFKPIEAYRARRFPVVDEERGVVVAIAMEDRPVYDVDFKSADGKDHKVALEYPNTRGLMEIFKIRNGAIERVEGVSGFLPYYMPSPWGE